MHKLWTYKEFCEYVGCGIDHAKHMVRDGQVPCIRIGKRKLVRFLPDEVEKWVREDRAGHRSVLTGTDDENTDGGAQLAAKGPDNA